MKKSRRRNTLRSHVRKRSLDRSNRAENLTLPPKQDNYVYRTQPLRRRKLSPNTLYHPHASTVLRKRRPKTVVSQRRTVRRTPLLGLKGRTPGKRNICTQRAARKSVLFTKRLVGFSGSSPGKQHTYKRTVDSNASCR